MLDKLTEELNSKVSLNNLLDEEIIRLSQELDREIVKEMKGE